ncbi:unnamed protein product [Leptidea sinapis]|uniref:Uncharacterized protein n=1 Tax=Leptidea sinapis TaxID=189913 RepID=A0A5E4Q370_9NEOP|nr:unnamed protein product [Leptidea sinapis]
MITGQVPQSALNIYDPVIVRVLLLAAVVRCEQTANNGYSRNDQLQYGDILRPPPPPPLPILPVPFHGGSGRHQHNYDFTSPYQVPPPQQPPQNLPSPPISPPSDFKFPAPFYKQYNFNFVPAPQPFSTTPSPTMFQKVSQWLFPSQQTANNMGVNTYNIPVKKECNPCNLAPWIPVIRYDLSSKNQQNIISTYGPPTQTASVSSYNTIQTLPQRFNAQPLDQSQSQILNNNNFHSNYGPPSLKHIDESNSVSSTYGPPSQTYSIPTSQIPQKYTNNINTNPSTNTFGKSYFDVVSINSGPSFQGGYPSSSYGGPTSSYKVPPSIYVTQPTISTNKHNSPSKNSFVVEDLVSTHKPSLELQLPKVDQPTGFRNSYGEPIVNTYALDVPYSVSATAAETSKVKTEVLPNADFLSSQNVSLALANPAPFTLNKGRNIHTLQPIALPNLSVSPLPPIFNARPFRPLPFKYPSNIIQSINLMDHKAKNVNITKSVPIAEFIHSIEYPTTIIQSPIIDLEVTKNINHTKAFRDIQNSFIIDNISDISPQASEDHLSATKSNPDSSFETTGADYGNDLYENAMPSDLKYQYSVPSNHKPPFADLRGVKDEDVDRYRTEANLQHIDSPLLYLKPSAPHKDFKSFVSASVPNNTRVEFEMYDDHPTTLTNLISASPNFLLGNITEPSQKVVNKNEKPENINRSKLVQIIVPYFSGNNEHSIDYYDVNGWSIDTGKGFQARKAQSNLEYNVSKVTTEIYKVSSTEATTTTATDNSNTERMNTDPPFDIIQLQHNIDDWTQQEYSKHNKAQERSRSGENYAKKIPDDYFTTLNPVTTSPTEMEYFDFYDHEGSSSIHYAVTENKTNVLPFVGKGSPFKQPNSIDYSKVNHDSAKNDEIHDDQRLRIYTAASKFRKSTTTPPPWSEIQTSISPLTQEKVYVVTSKPWQETVTSRNGLDSIHDERSAISKNNDDMPFKSPS